MFRRIACVFLLFAAPASAQRATSVGCTAGQAPAIRILQLELQRELDTQATPGIAGAIVSHDSVLALCVGGIIAESSHQAVTTSTAFHAASISKTVTSAAALREVLEGHLELDAPVSRYLEAFAVDTGRPVTIRDLLQHTSGLPDVDDYEWERGDGGTSALAENVAIVARELRRRLRDGKPRYTNAGFDVLGAVIERVSGQEFAEYVRTNLFAPLGLQHSAFGMSVADTLALGHVKRDGMLQETGVFLANRAHAPSSTLHFTAPDLAIWMQLHLAHGAYGATRVLPDSIYRAMWDASKPFIGTSGTPVDRSAGLGWLTGQRLGQFAAWHPGGDLGYRSYMMLLPDSDIAVGVLCNSGSCDPGGIVSRTLSALLTTRTSK